MSKKQSDKQVKKILKKINVLILGPGHPKNELKFRKDVKKKLKQRGINAFIMEEQKQAKRNITHIDKFNDLLGRKHLLCIAIHTPKGSQLGVTFEVGYLCGRYWHSKSGRKKLKDQLGFLFTNKRPKEEILTSYLHSGLFIDGTIEMQNDYNSIIDIVNYVEAWTKNRAEKLGLLKR